MCLICVDLQRQRMTTFEARRALGEMVEGMEPEHIREVQARIKAAEEAERLAQQQQPKGATPSTSSVAGAVPGSSATSVSTS